MDRIDALRLLLDIAHAGNFSRVARQRAIATSTVALAVRQLETEFGTRLMTRSTRQLAFTHEGDTLLADARRIVAEWDTALRSARALDPLAGPIRITVTNDFGRHRLRPLLDSFQDRHPGIHISLLLSDGIANLIEEQIDLAIRCGPLPDSSLHARLLMRGHRRICAAPAYWARAGKPSHPNDLAHHNCLILARPGAPLSTWSFREKDKALSIKVNGDRQASDGDILRQWAIEGLGIVQKNQWDIQNELQNNQLETALDAYDAGQIDQFAVYHNPPTRRVAALVKFLASKLKQIQEPSQI